MKIPRFLPQIETDASVFELREHMAKRRPLPLRIAAFITDRLMSSGMLVAIGGGLFMIAVLLMFAFPDQKALILSVVFLPACLLASVSLAATLPWELKGRRLRKATEPVQRALRADLYDWLKENYGLSVIPGYRYGGKVHRETGKAEDRQLLEISDDLVHGRELYQGGWLFETADGIELQAKLVSVGRGVYELQKVKLRDPLESPHFNAISIS